MTDEQLTRLSAFVDGELAGRGCLPLYQDLARDPELRATWERYHLIGQVLRGERVRREVRGVATTVHDSLDREPAPLCPPVAPGRVRVWWSPFAGAALAAAAALLAVFAVPGLYEGPADAPVRRLAAAVPADTSVTLAGARRWQTDRDDLAGKLDLFLVAHQETQAATVVRGLLPYVTLVGYEQPRR